MYQNLPFLSTLEQMIIEIEVFHGTNHTHLTSIKQENFKSSKGTEHEQWLGDGVYFFTKGVPPNPEETAENWAIAEAWDNEKRRYSYRKYCVIRALINVDASKFLDLSDWDCIETFNYLRNLYIEKLRQERKKLKHGDFKDGHIINKALENIGLQIDVVRGNFYFKFRDDRICNAQFKTPNCTVIAVRNLNCIDIDSIQLHKSNNIK